MLVIGRIVIRHTRCARVHIGTAQILGRDNLARRRLHQRRAAQKDRALFAHNNRLVRHRRHIGSARRTGAHHHSDLGNALRRHVGLVVEDATEMLAIGENIRLMGQVRAATVHEVHAGQTVLHGDFLRPQMFFHRHRIIGAALDGRVIADDHDFAPGDTADAGNHARTMHIAFIHAVRRQGPDFHEGRPRVQQTLDTLAWQQLAARQMFLARAFRSAPCSLCGLGMELAQKRIHGGMIGVEALGSRIDRGNKLGHGKPRSSGWLRRCLTRPINKIHLACIQIRDPEHHRCVRPDIPLSVPTQ